MNKYIIILLITFTNINCAQDSMIILDDDCDWAVSDGIEPCGENERCVNDIQIIDMTCIPTVCLTKDEFVINDDSAYKYDFLVQYYDTLCFPPCPDSLLPLIDFSKRTLLAKYAESGGCKLIYSYKVLIDENAKHYTFVTRIQKVGTCNLHGFKLHCITVPKIPNGYSVSFNVSEELCERMYLK